MKHLTSTWIVIFALMAAGPAMAAGDSAGNGYGGRSFEDFHRMAQQR